jgi:hypothetical protein
MKKCFIPLFFLSALLTTAATGSDDKKQPAYRTCSIGFLQDWTGLEGPGVVKRWSASARDDPFWKGPVWNGKELPEFAKALVGGEICPERDSRGLQTRRYFILENQDCDKKELYAQEYYDFWRAQGRAIPKLTRLPDHLEFQSGFPGTFRSCADHLPPTSGK